MQKLRYFLPLCFLGLVACTHHVHTTPAVNDCIAKNSAAHYQAQLALKYINQGALRKAQKTLHLAYKISPNDPLVLEAMREYARAKEMY